MGPVWAAGYVAVDETGQWLRLEGITDRFQALAAEAEVPITRLHDTRGTLCSIMAEQGAPVEVRSALIGHSEQVNLARYTSISADAMAAAMRTDSGG